MAANSLILLFSLFLVSCTPEITPEDVIETGGVSLPPYGCAELIERGEKCNPSSLPNKTPISYKELSEIVQSVHYRFTYKEDIEQYDSYEHWIGMDEVPSGYFYGDCEDFAQAVRKELEKIGQPSRIAGCAVDSKRINHAVVVYDNWIIDNNNQWPVSRSDILNYDCRVISGYTDDEPWREIVYD